MKMVSETGITVVICTHNRAQLLASTLASLNDAIMPPGLRISILVIANACSDETVTILTDYQSDPDNKLPLQFSEEPIAGKSNALNRAIKLVDDGFIAFVDDDHRIDKHYYAVIDKAIRKHPDGRIFCGKIIPDWTGDEPGWIHDQGRFKIYPLPIPHFELGDRELHVDRTMKIPGGGNLIVHSSVFAETGGFSTSLGPKGHDLAGSEDSDFVLRALANGIKLIYIPEIIQYHFVDLDRLKLSYLVKKSYQRTRTLMVAKRSDDKTVPLYLWKKLGIYFFQLLFSLKPEKRRFYMMRVASTLGEIEGRRQSIKPST